MDSCGVFCALFAKINWIWFGIAVIICFSVGAVWYSFLFAKTWVRVFKVEMTEKPSTPNMIRVMLTQLLVNILFGIALTLLAKISVMLAFFILIAFCGWQKGALNFQFPKLKDYFQAAIIQAGYTFIAGSIFILMSLI